MEEGDQCNPTLWPPIVLAEPVDAANHGLQALHRLVVRARSAPASLRALLQGCIPDSRRMGDHGYQHASKREQVPAHLVLLLPVEKIIDLTATADLHVFSRANEHVAGGDDIRDRRKARIFSCEPDSDRNVVRCPAV